MVSQQSMVNQVNAYVSKDTCQPENEPWVLDDVRKGGDVEDSDWLIWANPVLTPSSLDFARYHLFSKILGIREDRTPDLPEG